MNSRSGTALDLLTYGGLLTTAVLAASGYITPLAPLVGLLFPAAATLTGALLIGRKPGFYLGFMWWVWFLTPEVRRIVDFRIGYNEQSLVMLAPFLVSGIALLAVFSRLTKLAPSFRAPFAFTSLGLLYAFCVGFLNNGLFAAAFDLLNWSAPIILGVYLLTHIDHIAVFERVTRQTFMWGLLVMGVYGVVQYFYLPPWDAYWMTQANMASIGYPVAQQVRAFSTLNSPGPYANVVMAGLLLAFSGGGPLQSISFATGFMGFALSAVRSAWGGWFVGMLIILTQLPLRQRARLLGTLSVLVLICIPLFSLGPVGALFSERLATVTDLENDMSYNDRLELYASLSSFTANNPLGQGLGSSGVASNIGNPSDSMPNLDSGIIAVLYTFGILGTLYFVGGALTLFFRALMTGRRAHTVNAAIYAGITVGAMAQLFFGNAWNGVSGMVLWFFPCLLLASQQALAYEQRQAARPLTPERLRART